MGSTGGGPDCCWERGWIGLMVFASDPSGAGGLFLSAFFRSFGFPSIIPPMGTAPTGLNARDHEM